MRICIPIITLLLILSAGPVFSQQMSKEETKEWKKKANEYKKNPAALKALHDQRDQLLDQQSQFQGRLNSLETELMTEKAKVVDLEAENIRLNNSLAAAQQNLMNLQNQQAEAERMRQEMATQKPEVSEGGMPMGTVFMIQVGAFKKGGVPEKFYKYDDLFVEEAGGMQKILLGQYRSYDDAKARLNQLKREGYKSAWIVPFMDGQRVSLKEAMQNQ